MSAHMSTHMSTHMATHMAPHMAPHMDRLASNARAMAKRHVYSRCLMPLCRGSKILSLENAFFIRVKLVISKKNRPRTPFLFGVKLVRGVAEGSQKWLVVHSLIMFLLIDPINSPYGNMAFDGPYGNVTWEVRPRCGVERRHDEGWPTLCTHGFVCISIHLSRGCKSPDTAGSMVTSITCLHTCPCTCLYISIHMPIRMSSHMHTHVYAHVYTSTSMAYNRSSGTTGPCRTQAIHVRKPRRTGIVCL